MRTTQWVFFTSDWMTKWSEFLKPITQRSDAESNQPQFTFYTQEIITRKLAHCVVIYPVDSTVYTLNNQADLNIMRVSPPSVTIKNQKFNQWLVLEGPPIKTEH